ncbi:DUF6174 domain-containing protein [Lutibacter sp.]
MKNFLLLFMLLIIVSCTKSDDSVGLIFEQESYNTNRELWKNSGINDYTFIQEYSSTSVGGLPKLITVVIDGKLDTIYALSNLDHNYPIENGTNYKTINDVFDFISSIVDSCNMQINSSDSPMLGAKIEVEYDKNYYFPSKIKCVGYYNESLLGGLSIVITISDFEIN